MTKREENRYKKEGMTQESIDDLKRFRLLSYEEMLDEIFSFINAPDQTSTSSDEPQ